MCPGTHHEYTTDLQAPGDQVSELVVRKQHLEAALRVILPSVSAKDEKRYVVRGRRHVRSTTQGKGLDGDVEVLLGGEAILYVHSLYNCFGDGAD